jgi:replication factor C subunit 3/5
MSQDEMLVDGSAHLLAGVSKGKGKGKEKAADPANSIEDDNLPWCVDNRKKPIGVQRNCRVEKYRPATLNDVVSHKDITSTSKL